MRTLASKRERWVILTTRPADPDAVTADEANDGERIECELLAASRISATGATTVSEASLCEDEVNVPVQRQFEGSLTAFSLYNEDGTPSEDDVILEALREFGTRVWILTSKGPKHTEDFEDGQGYSLYEVLTDEPQEPSDRGAYFKQVYPLFVQRAWTNKVIAAGSS